MADNALLGLEPLGQSLWLDYIRRGLITSGELGKMIKEDGLKGVTSNPTIFEKAIAGSTDYNEAMKNLVSQGKGVEEIYDALVLEDIGKAADLFLPVYEKTKRADGFVSIEVSPDLAYETEKTIKEARRLFALLDRSNIMIKVPGTVQGIHAVETLIGDGINVNITLLFDIENYEAVMEAYLRGLELRMERGQSLDTIASVASFFVSRVDTAVDKLLDEKIAATSDQAMKEKLKRLQGKAAVANAKLAYQKFREVFESERFKNLRVHRARVQRPLWASTSTKNPVYSDILYVEELIGKDTVNTMPPETVQAFKDHGRPRLSIEENIEQAKQVMKELAEVGISLKQVTKKLQEDGVKSFADSFQKLWHCIATKRETFLGSALDRQTASLGSLGPKVDASLEWFQSANVVKRIWEKDATLWKKNPEHEKVIKERLGWLTVVETMMEQADRLNKLAQSAAAEKTQDVVLLGMGGSSLCPDVFRHTFGKQKGFPRLHVLDSTDPATIQEVESGIDIKRTIFIVSSKSGGTTETDSLFKHFYEKNGGDGRSFIAITDPGTSLERLARGKNFREVFLNPPEIGGRYSALSYFGLVPAALMGLDVKKLLEAAEKMAQSCVPWIPVRDNPGAILGAILGESYKSGRDKITFIVSPPIHAYGSWAEQLLAESTGKDKKGLVPIDGEPVGDPSSYGQDRLFIYIHLRAHHDEQIRRKVKALEEAGHPVVRITLENPYDLAEEFFRWEFATAVAGVLMKIDAFDQPNVQESKDNTKALLEVYVKEGKLPEEKPLLEESGLKLFAKSRSKSGKTGVASESLSQALSGYLDDVKPGDYIALMAYLHRTGHHDEMFDAMRLRLRGWRRVATTLGYGPRFLHSTGQLHKGGGNNGIYIQFTADDASDIPIPGEPYTFGVLKQAQALGDYQSLQKRKRRLIRVHLGQDAGAGLRKFLTILEEVVAVKSVR